MENFTVRQVLRSLSDEMGGQTIKSAIGILFFIIFIGSGAVINYASLPLSYNIAFGDSGSNSGSGGGGGGGWGGGSAMGGGSGEPNCGAGNYSYTFSPKTKALIDSARITVYYDQASQSRTIRAARNADDLPMGSVKWMLSEQAITEDRERAMAEIPFCHSTNYLIGSSLGFELPQGAAVKGITLEIKRSANGPDVLYDRSVRLVYDAAIRGDEHRDKAAWPSNDAWHAYGGDRSEWNAGFSWQEINSPLFGFALAAYNGPEDVFARQAAANALPAASQPASVPTGTPVSTTDRPATTAQSGSPAATFKPGSAGDIAILSALPTPLGRKSRGETVKRLQRLLIKWRIGPEARELARWGATGAYGWRTERAVAELQNMLMKNPKGPAAQALMEVFAKFKYGRGTFGPATQSAEIEYLSL